MDCWFCSVSGCTPFEGGGSSTPYLSDLAGSSNELGGRRGFGTGSNEPKEREREEKVTDLAYASVSFSLDKETEEPPPLPFLVSPA